MGHRSRGIDQTFEQPDAGLLHLVGNHQAAAEHGIDFGLCRTPLDLHRESGKISPPGPEQLQRVVDRAPCVATAAVWRLAAWLLLSVQVSLR